MRGYRVAWALVGWLVAAPLAAAAPSVEPARLAALVDDAVQRYALPGIAVGVVVDGEVVLRHARGELRAGEGEAVDAATLFKIASNSKAMTAAVLARLVDAGRLRWDDPVVRHLPEFRMYEDWVTREIQVRDLLIHNSGLGPGAGDLMLWPSPNAFTRAQVIAGLRHLRPRWSFRARYAYDNTLYIVAGEVAAAAGGAPYDALVRREVFAPLGMTRCQAGAWQRDAVGNVAQPHARIGGRNVVVRGDEASIPDEPMMAAGGLRCSLDDMLRWAQAWLDPGAVDAAEGPWLSAVQREAAWTAHMPMPLTARMRAWDRSHFSAYGYGWRLTDVDGTAKVSHTGTLSGMVSSLVLLPERGVGIVVLINGDADEARTVLTQALVKQFVATDGGAHDVGYYAALLDAARRADTGDAVPPEADTAVPVSTAVAASLAGRYRDPWFGEVALCPRDGALRWIAARSPKLDGNVVAVGGGLRVRWRASDVDVDAWLRPTSVRGRVQALQMAKVDPDADFSYDFEDLALVRVGDCD
ncbi:serine hydrolase domain-containing protein [Luteimonas sp. FCS-9]|uniref:serine hydrolase domain-containing protein n=1 Tax=Luteimonas sp. FCS-9 TaxID=1547516 RepID=UPI00063E740A|nr:serine hydrolase domain-containing protein [Luteimonas sp. FCS-9]KLJ01329.1 penicillin-binding protein [Luteimonas sp. FCS-9]